MIKLMILKIFDNFEMFPYFPFCQVRLCMRDADQTLHLMVQLQALPLALQISKIVGMVWSR